MKDKEISIYSLSDMGVCAIFRQLLADGSVQFTRNMQGTEEVYVEFVLNGMENQVVVDTSDLDVISNETIYEVEQAKKCIK